MIDSFFPILFAAVVGFGHAFEADHLLAVSNIVSKRNSVWMALKDGIAWGLGHTSTIFLVGMLIIGFKITISEQVFQVLEASVGLVLVLLGVFRLFVLARSGKVTHHHFHLSDLWFGKKSPEKDRAMAPYNFSPARLKETEMPTFQYAPTRKNHHLAYGVGLIHGLAGSGTLVVLVMSQINGLGASLLYLLIFGIGSIAGMLLASGLFSLPFSKKITTNRSLQKSLTLLSSLLCIGYGIWVVVENLLMR